MKHILIAEDYQPLCTLFIFLFRQEGYTVTAVEDGLALLRLAETLQPDVILTDLDLPEVGGVDAIAHLRASARTRSIPIIAQSADRYHGAAALTAGAEAFFEKPALLDDLLQAVQQAVTRKC